MKMNTQRIVGELIKLLSPTKSINAFLAEYNPKLSEATPTTRVAYVKFMAKAMRKEQTDDEKEEKPSEPPKSILRTSSKV